MGKVFDLCRGWSVTPQLQGIFTRITNDSFNELHGDRVRYDDTDSITARAGVALNRERIFTTACGDVRRLEGYLLANVYREFKGETRMTVGNTRYSAKGEKWWGGLGVGGTFDWRDSKYSVYGEVEYRASFNGIKDNHILHGEVGFRMNF